MALALTVRRQWFTARSTAGQLAIDGLPECFTLEPPKTPIDDEHKPCHAPGIFPLTIRWSPKFQKPVPHVESVPGFTAIEIHVGNTAEDTIGCTCVGRTHPRPDFIGVSNVAFIALMAKLYAGATLANPDSPEQNQVWDVGTITYEEV